MFLDYDVFSKLLYGNLFFGTGYMLLDNLHGLNDLFDGQEFQLEN